MRVWIAIGMLVFAAGALARWPERPVRLVLPGPQGGEIDSVARILAERLGGTLGRSFVTEYRPGGSGLVAAETVVGAPADAHTLLVTASEFMTVVPNTQRAAGGLPRRLRPVAELARSALILVGNPSLPANSLRSLVDYARAHPGTQYGSYGEGSVGHIAGLMLNRHAGVDVRHVGLQGAPTAQAALFSGKVPLIFDAVASAVPLVREGRIKAFAVSSAQRSEFLPAVPTFRELGYEEMIFTGWIGVFVPDKVPTPLLEAMRRELTGALASATVRNRLRQLYFDAPEFSTPAQLEAALRAASRRGALLAPGYRIPR